MAKKRASLIKPQAQQAARPGPAADSKRAQPLAIAAELVSRLAEANLRFGIYKNIAALAEGLSGRGDLDMLVAAVDRSRFYEVVVSLSGVRGYPSAFYDNSVDDREDWFVPDASGGYLHLDVCFGLRIGRKFRKRYLALDWQDIGDWHNASGCDLPLPVLSAFDEARIAVLRAIFRCGSWPAAGWIRSPSECAALLDRAWPARQQSLTLGYHFGGEELACEVRRGSEKIELGAKAIRRLRRSIRAKNGAGPLAGFGDLVIHHLRRGIFAALSRLTRASPGRTVTKRSLRPSGKVIALVGPDGVGKSTQTSRAVATFQKKFRCTSVYLGSNDGSWMAARSKLRAFRRKHGAVKEALGPKLTNRELLALRTSERRVLRTIGVSIWRLVMGLQRYAAIRKAMRLSASGAIVFTDRWPQNIGFGMLDGPSVPPPPEMRLASLISRLEQSVYRHMDRLRPDLTIHFDADFATSHARKPGDIEQEDFELRLALMRRLREREAGIVMVDARQPMEQVSQAVVRQAWQALLRIGPKASDSFDDGPLSSPIASISTES